ASRSPTDIHSFPTRRSSDLDVIDPNRNVDQAFRSTTFNLKNGQFISGLVLREEGDVIVVADAQGKEQRLVKTSVEERIVSQLSRSEEHTSELQSPYDLVCRL